MIEQASAATIFLWDKELSRHNLGMDRGLRLGIRKIVYVGTPNDLRSNRDWRPVYCLLRKTLIPNPYYVSKGGHKRVSAEHTRARKRENKRQQRLRQGLAVDVGQGFRSDLHA